MRGEYIGFSGQTSQDLTVLIFLAGPPGAALIGTRPPEDMGWDPLPP